LYSNSCEDNSNIQEGVDKLYVTEGYQSDYTERRSESLWEDYDKEKGVEEEDRLCTEHGRICKKGICKTYSKLLWEAEKAKKVAEREKKVAEREKKVAEREKKKAEREKKKGKGRNRGKGKDESDLWAAETGAESSETVDDTTRSRANSIGSGWGPITEAGWWS